MASSGPGNPPAARRAAVRGSGRTGSSIDVAIGGIACLVILVTIAACVYAFDPAEPNPRIALVLAGTAGATLGWATGIILSPYEETSERQAFRGIGKAVTGAIVGYAAAKIDPVVDVLVRGARTGSLDPVLGTGLGVGMSCFVAVATLTYVSRKYWD